jgi:hypothetical protein
MSEFLTSFFLTIIGFCSAASLVLSIISLLIHWKRPQVHPDVARVDNEIQGIRTSILELFDRVEHWMKRDRVRKLRDAQEAKQEAPQGEIAPAAPMTKAELRRKHLGRLSTVSSIRGGYESTGEDS